MEWYLYQCKFVRSKILRVSLVGIVSVEIIVSAHVTSGWRSCSMEGLLEYDSKFGFGLLYKRPLSLP